jgi:hypothetical protein
MEAFYSQVHLHDQFVADLPRGRGRRRNYGWAMTYFLRVIPLLFGACLADEPCDWHRALVRSLDARDVVVSFNYDCIIDAALRDVARRKWNPATGYGVSASGDLAAWRKHAGTGRFPKQGHRLLKPHGSLNWRVSEGSRLRLLRNPFQERPETTLCIVPPLWQKSFDAFPFHQVWLQARQALTTTKALVVIGYSLPTTDVYTQAMLRIDVQDLDFLLVANPDVESRNRIKRVLRSALSSTTRVVELDSLAQVGQLLREHEAAEARKWLPTIEKIQDIVARRFRVTPEELRGDKRSQNIVFPRQLAMYLSRELTDSSLPRIGKDFGGRDHTTVIHATSKIARLIRDDRSVHDVVQELTERVGSPG